MARTLSIAVIAQDLASKTLDGVAASADATGASLTKAQTKFSSFATNVSKTTLLAAAAVTVMSVKMATDFQKQMTLLETAGGQTAASVKVISDGILNLAVSTGTSTAQLANGAYIVAKAGYAGADAVNVLKAAAEGAKAENVDLATSTTALTSVMMSYHMTASQAVSVENMLVAGSGKAKTSMQEYAGALSTVIPVASAANINFSQVAGAIATLTQHGTSADESTQELANTIRNLQAPSSVAIKAMQQVGINVTDLETGLGTRGLTGTIQLVTNAIATKLGPQGTVLVNSMIQSATGTADLNVMLAKMPAPLQKLSQGFLDGSVSMSAYRTGFRGMGASGSAMGSQFMALAQQVNGYNAQVKAGGPAAQTAAAALKNIMGGATGLNTALMLGGENMKTFVADTNAVAAAGAKSGANISTWSKTQATLAVQLDQAREMVEVLGIRIGTDLLPTVVAVTKELTTHKTIVFDVVLALAAFGVAVTTAKIAMGLWNVVTAVTTGLQTGYKLATAGSTAVTEAQTGIVEKSAIAWGVQKLTLAAVTIATKSYAIAQWLLNAAMTANPIVAVVAGLAALALGIYEAYKHCKPFRDAVNDIGNALKPVYTDVLKPIAEYLMGHWKTALLVAGLLFAPWLTVPILIVKNWGKILDFFESLPGLLLGYLGDAGKWLLGLGEKAATGMLDGLKSIFVTLPRNIYRWVVSEGGLTGIGIKLAQALLAGIKSGWRAAVTFFTAMPGVILGLLKTAGTWLLSTGESVATGLWNGITSEASIMWNWFTSLPGLILKYTVKADTWLIQTGKDMLTGAKSGITSGAVDLWSFFTGLPGKILAAAGDATKWLVNLGKDIITGIIHGIENMASDLGNALHTAIVKAFGFAGKLAAGAAKFLGISLDSGGAVPGPVGAPMPAIVHGGEYMLSRGMLTGQAAIDPAVARAVMANIAKAGAMSALAAGFNPASAKMDGLSTPGTANNTGKTIQITNHIYGQSDPVATANATTRRIVAAVI